MALGLSTFTGQTEGYAASTGSTLDTGDLRRRYDFKDTVSSLRIMQDPYFRIMSKLRKGSVSDTQPKFAEKRPSFHKRYGYVTAHGTASTVTSTTDATLTASEVAAGSTYYWKMGTDYKSAGNITNRYGQSSGAFSVGAAGTKPEFFLPGQTIKINTGATWARADDYLLAKIKSVTDVSTTHVILETEIVKTMRVTGTNVELCWASATAPVTTVYSTPTAAQGAAGTTENLEDKRTYVVGAKYAQGSGLPETWADQPYSTGYGLTEIQKTVMSMDNSTRATEFKFARNEWERIWEQKLIEDKWNITESLLFSSQYTDSDGVQHTQGIIDYILQYGNIFSLSNLATKTQDNFLDDMSQFLDPRVNSADDMVYLCDTTTYNWLNQLAGYSKNTLNSAGGNVNWDFAIKGENVLMKQMIGVEGNIISTRYGEMTCVRDIHLDGSPVRMVGIALPNVEYCPLIGNGINRDTHIIVGAQTAENSGVDARVDNTLTEFCQICTLPETHAAWLKV